MVHISTDAHYGWLVGSDYDWLWLEMVGWNCLWLVFVWLWSNKLQKGNIFFLQESTYIGFMCMKLSKATTSSSSAVLCGTNSWLDTKVNSMTKSNYILMCFLCKTISSTTHLNKSHHDQWFTVLGNPKQLDIEACYFQRIPIQMMATQGLKNEIM